MTDGMQVADGIWSGRHRGLTTGLLLTVVLTAFEVLAVATVMPVVVRELGGLPLYGWAFSAFFLGSLLGTVIVPGVLERRGLAITFQGSLLLFGAGLVLAGTAGSMPVLVAARFVQGLGAGALTPVAYVAIGRGLPEELRPRMLAMMSSAWVLPAVLGPGAAGLIAETVGWRPVFLGLLPLLFVASLLSNGPLVRLDLRAAAQAGVAPEPDRPGPAAGSARSEPRRVSLAVIVTIGAALVTAGLAVRDAVVVGGVGLPGPVVLVAMLGLGIVMVAASFRRLTPPGTLTLARGLPAAVFLRGILTAGFFAVDAYVALALIEWRGLPAGVAGLVLASGSLAWTAGSWIQARWALRLGYPTFVRAGFAVLAVGILVFTAALDRDLPLALAFLGFAVAGCGMGLAYAPQWLIVLREAPPERQGEATSAINLSDLLGTALGTGLSGAILAAGLGSGASTGGALLPAFLMGAAAALAGFLFSGRLRPAKQP